ncbi:ATP-dependent helicase HrpB [Granulosicoccaceae sp. 1_MG-2023]|nr:ATP-dependent helicase HrpB [Granulosicoccaceae sp. 1_MG-2023]
MKPDLPIIPLLSDICDAILKGRDLIISATPGAGKSTMIPQALLKALPGKLLLVQPRRVAAVGVARRIAHLLGEPCPATVGYRTRPETRISGQTRLEVVTEGIFLRMLQSDPELGGFSAVLLDECHERSINMDLGLSLLDDMRAALRDDLPLVLMSATLETDAFRRLVPQALCLSCEAPVYPVETVYQAAAGWRPETGELLRAIGTALDHSDGDILCFLPGRGEIRRLHEALQNSPLKERAGVFELHGSLPVAEQDAIAHPPAQHARRIILSTAIAETSLTIDGVTGVVDSGLARREVFDVASGMNRLITTRASDAAATQRRGRAGRTAAGFCVRLWSAHERREAHPAPQISESGLTSLCLELALWGVSDPQTLNWITPPPAAAFGQARTLLQQLGLLDEQGRITPTGRAAGRLGTDPRLAAMLLNAADDMRETACLLAAALGESALRDGGDDLEASLRALQRQGKGPAATIRRNAAQLRKRLPATGGKAGNTGLLIATAFPDRIALQRRPGGQEYLLSNGKGARLGNDSALLNQPCLAIADLSLRQDGALIRHAAPLNPNELPDHFPALMHEQEALESDADSGQILLHRRLCLGELTLSEQRSAPPPDYDLTPLLLAAVQDKGKSVLNWTDACDALCARSRFVAALEPDGPVAALDSTQLLAEPQAWLAPFLAGVRSLRALAGVNIQSALEAYLGWDCVQRLNTLAPPDYTLPTGRRVAIDYSRPAQPAISARIQELFSLTTHPSLAGGRVPLQISLLSPARRPVQVTADLPGFWQGSYQDVKKEMKGRYPKHHWPDDPAHTAAHSSVRPT